MSESLVRVKTAPDLKIWVPDSVGAAAEAKAQRAVKDYDERLSLARHNITGDWCVYLTRGPFGEPYPVLGLGHELPHPEDICKLLFKYDSVRNGEQILNQINRQNEAILAEKQAAASEASGLVAEAQESFLHDIGRTPYRRTYLSKTGVENPAIRKP